MGRNLWRSDHCDGDSGPLTAPRHHDQHPQGELPAEGPAWGRTVSRLRTGTGAAGRTGRGSAERVTEARVGGTERRMSIGGELVDFLAIKSAVSLAQVLRSDGMERLRSRRRDQLEGRCPIRRGRRWDAFHVSLSKWAFQCFACQARSNVLDFVAAMGRVFGTRGGPTAGAKIFRSGHRAAAEGKRGEVELVREKGRGEPTSFVHPAGRRWLASLSANSGHTAGNRGSVWSGFLWRARTADGTAGHPDPQLPRPVGGLHRALARRSASQIPAAGRIREIPGAVQLPSGREFEAAERDCGGRILGLLEGFIRPALYR